MEVELIRQYTLIVDFLGHVLGPDYEIALHELEDDSNRIIAIANGELTGRHCHSRHSWQQLPDRWQGCVLLQGYYRRVGRFKE